MSSKDILLIVVLFFGVAAAFTGVGLHTHGHSLGWATIGVGAVLVVVAHRGLRS